jgi:DNA-binding NarL/FixJ family response regulator
MDGLELIRQLRARRPELKILVFSLHQEKFYQKQAAAAGADAFVGKDQGPARVVAALRNLLRHAPGIAQIGSTASGHSPGTYASR